MQTRKRTAMQTFLEMGMANTVVATALALVAAAIGLCCHRPAVRHILWLLVLLKLVTPPVLAIPVRLPSALEAALPQDTVTEDLPTFSEEELIGLIAGPLPARTGEIVIAESPTLASVSLVPFLFMIWLAGAVWWFVVAAARIHRFQRLLHYGGVAPPALQDETRQLANHLGLARCPIVWLVPGRISPLLWALGRNVYLVLPADLLQHLGPGQRTSLLAHELAHARRRDHWVRWLEFGVSGLYWWLPVAWWARRQLQQAEEECCDAWVVWTLPTAAKAYAKALLQTVDFLDARPALPPVASGIGHVHL